MTGQLTRFILRRDRIRLPVWIIVIAIITITVAVAFVDLYPTESERQAIAQTMLNPAMVAMIGQPYGIDNYTIGAILAHQMLLFTAIAAAIMNILLMTRHTRTDEEEGRIELIRSLPTGRLSNLSAALLVLFGVNAFMALVIGGGLYVLQIESVDFTGSFVYGAAIGAAGFFFAAITALFAQMSENARGTIGLAFTLLIGAYLLRAVGDVSNEALFWMSPLGWILGTEAYVNNYWWPIFLTIGVAFIVASLALYLDAKRDLGSGLLPPRAGRRFASPLLLSPLGLAVRIQRTALISWLLGIFILSVSYGAVMGDIDVYFEGNELMEQLLVPLGDVSLAEQFIALIMVVMAMICVIPVLMVVLKLKSEELNNRTEHLYSRAASRSRVMGGYLVISLVTAIATSLLSALGIWSAAYSVMDEPLAMGTMLTAAMANLPAIWVMSGLAVLLLGIAPKLTGFTWIYLGYSFFVIYFGGLMQLPNWLTKLTPFGYVPQVPIEEFQFINFTLLTLLALVLIVIGFIGYNKRDLYG